MRAFIFYQVESALDEARLRLAQTAPPFSVSVFSQTGGRGKAGAAWYGAAGNAALTLALPESAFSEGDAPAAPGAVTFTAGLALLQTLRCYLPRAAAARIRLKWPNDIYVGDRKIAGVLTERVPDCYTGNMAGCAVLLIGIGVNMRVVPPAAASYAAALPAGKQGRANAGARFAQEIYARLMQLVRREDKGRELYNPHTRYPACGGVFYHGVGSAKPAFYRIGGVAADGGLCLLTEEGIAAATVYDSAGITIPAEDVIKYKDGRGYAAHH